MKRKLYLVIVINVLVFATFVAAVSAGTQPSGVLRSIPSQSGLVGTAPQTAQAPQAPEGSGFTYQGRLKDGNNPANGSYDLQFTLYDAASGGNAAGGPITLLNQTVTDGLFTVQLDFGSSANQGSARWLGIAVRQAGGGTYTTLSPRQPLTAAPYAMSLMPGAVITGTLAASPVISVTNTGGGTGVYGSAAVGGVGVSGVDTATSGFGVRGNGDSAGVSGTGNDYGVYGTGNFGVNGSGSNIGVYGTGTNYGVSGIGHYGVSGNGFDGVYGTGTSSGVFGTGAVFGTFGQTNSSTGVGVFGENDGTGGTAIGGQAYGTGSYGVWGAGDYGVYGTGSSYGVYGESNIIGGAGVYGYNPSNIGVYGQGGYAVYGSGVGNNSTAIYGNSVGTGSWAGYFSGNVNVTGTCCAAEQGTYKIDDPLDPANKYLNQAAVESDEMKDIYDGVATLDADGGATVTMPTWFQALNRDFRYQLTAIGAPGPDLYVAQEIQSNQFRIAGGKPGMKVSWQVTGVRQDPYANDHPLQVEQPKTSDEQGTYLYPKGYGQPDSKGVDYEQQQKLKAQLPTSTQQPDSNHGK